MIKLWESIKTSSAQIPQPPYSDLPRVLCRECRPWSGRRFHQWLLQKRGWEAASISGKKFFLRVISTLKHYSDIVSDMPSRSTLSTFNYSDILSVHSAHWDLELAVDVRQCPLSSGARGWRRGGEEEKRRRGGKVYDKLQRPSPGKWGTTHRSSIEVLLGNLWKYGLLKVYQYFAQIRALAWSLCFSDKTTRVFNRPHEVLEGFLTQISGSPGS